MKSLKKAAAVWALAAGMTVLTAGFCMAAQTEQTGEAMESNGYVVGIDPGHQGPGWI